MGQLLCAKGDIIPDVVKVCNRLPRQAVIDFKARWDAFDAIYGGRGSTFEIAHHAMAKLHASREVMNCWFDIADDEAMVEVINEVITLLPDYEYLGILEIVREWYS